MSLSCVSFASSICLHAPVTTTLGLNAYTVKPRTLKFDYALWACYFVSRAAAGTKHYAGSSCYGARLRGTNASEQEWNKSKGRSRCWQKKPEGKLNVKTTTSQRTPSPRTSNICKIQWFTYFTLFLFWSLPSHGSLSSKSSMFWSVKNCSYSTCFLHPAQNRKSAKVEFRRA